MKIRLFTALALGVLGLTVQAKSATIVYLVGVRHIYTIPSYPDAHQADRQQIEEDYAAAVADAQKHYDADMASIHDEEAKDSGSVHQVDRDAVQENLEKDVADAADRRDSALTEIYQLSDNVRATHPEFKVEQDGPYKVVEVETAPTGEYTNVVYCLPYPAYIEPCPYGWVWGQPYPYVSWGVQIRIWHNMWLTVGCPFYEPMYYGDGVFVFSAPIRSEVVVDRGGWRGGRPPHITDGERSVINRNYEIQRRSGYFDRGPGGRPLSEFKRPNPSIRSVSRYSNSGSVSKYGRSANSRVGGLPAAPGVSRYSSSGSTTGASRYGRYSGGANSTATGVSRYSHSSSTSAGAASANGISHYGHSGSSVISHTPNSESNATHTSTSSTSSARSHGTQSGSITTGSGNHGSSSLPPAPAHSPSKPPSSDPPKKKGN